MQSQSYRKDAASAYSGGQKLCAIDGEASLLLAKRPEFVSARRRAQTLYCCPCQDRSGEIPCEREPEYLHFNSRFESQRIRSTSGISNESGKSGSLSNLGLVVFRQYQSREEVERGRDVLKSSKAVESDWKGSRS